jgi:formylglycine-generating enzyme required for sulfatase activity
VKTIRFVALLSALSAAFDLSISAQQTTTPSASSGFVATVANTSPAPKPAPGGMVWIPGGEFWMGSDEPQFPDARPWHRVYVDGFWMDKTEVTNEQFGEFVKATSYVTVAEHKPTKEQFPTAPEENLVAGSAVFSPPKESVLLDDHYQWWKYVKGANWRHPTGPDSDLRGKGKHPVVQIAYDDALAYCKWAGKRLPTEAEFEFAARGGLDRKVYVWGDEFRPGGKWMANTFQGHFPEKTQVKAALLAPRQSALFRKIAMVSMILPETSGNGATIGIGLITTRHWPMLAALREIRGGRRTVSIHSSRERRSVCRRAARTFARINTVNAICLAVAGMANQTPAPTILAFVA